LHAPLNAWRSAQQHVVEVHSLWRMSDTDATPLAFPAQRGIASCHLASMVPIGKHNDIADGAGEI